MSILSALSQQNSSIDELAKLPQTAIMQMAQRGEIGQDMVAPILGKKAEMADAIARDRALQQGGGQQPSVMDQIMQKNAQAEHPMMQPAPQMADAGVAQIPTKTPQYAGGGIVAFAGGGMYDSEAPEGEESEAEEMARLYPKSKLSELIDSGMSGIQGLMSKLPQSYTSAKAAADMKEVASKGSHPYEADAIKAAKQVGLDPSIMLHALYKESGGLKDPATARSKAGAYGPMQLMPATAKELGVDYKDPYQNILGGATYLKKQMDTFNDPSLALAAYNAGPGAVKKALSHKLGIASLPQETQGYMKYAAGGEVKHYADAGMVYGNTQDQEDMDAGSYSDQYDPNNPYLKRSRSVVEGIKSLGDTFTTPRNYDPITKLVLDPLESIRKWGQTPKEQQAAEFNAATNARKNVSLTDTSAPTAEATPAPATVVDATKNPTIENAKAPSPTLAGIKSPTTPAAINVIKEQGTQLEQPKTAEQNYWDEITKQIASGREENKAARESNRNMALLQAGLGILGGTSPYAMANIGAGALHGAQAYQQGQKEIQGQEKDLLSAQLGMAKYKSAAENAAAERAATEKYRETMFGQKGETAEATQSDRAYLRLQQIEKDIASRVLNQYKDNFMYKQDPNKFQSEIESKILALKQKDKLYNSLYERAMGAPPDFSTPVSAPTNRPPLGSFQK
jgi:soluble lytic murein transglycosylase-like protein